MKASNVIKDINGIAKAEKARIKAIGDSSIIPNMKDPINDIAKEVNPGMMDFKIIQITDVSSDTKAIRLVAAAPGAKLPPFQAGQYISLRINMPTYTTTRPYFISSSPSFARTSSPFVEITVKNNPYGTVAKYIYENFKVGDVILGHMPLGNFYYEPLRDARNLLAITDEAGIPMIYSFAQSVQEGLLKVNLTILYNGTESSLYVKEISKLDKVKLVVGDAIANIKDALSGDTSCYVVGVNDLKVKAYRVLKELNVKERRVRSEIVEVIKDITLEPEYPKIPEQKFNVTVYLGADEVTVQASSLEPLVVALEKAALRVDTKCRSGKCGFCRCQLIDGEVYVSKKSDERRNGDKKMGFIHPCSSYALSDLSIKIPIILKKTE